MTKATPPITEEEAMNGTAEMPIGCPEWCVKMQQALTARDATIAELGEALERAAQSIEDIGDLIGLADNEKLKTAARTISTKARAAHKGSV